MKNFGGCLDATLGKGVAPWNWQLALNEGLILLGGYTAEMQSTIVLQIYREWVQIMPNTTAMPTRALLIDDHSVVRDALEALLRGRNLVHAVDQACSLAEATQKLEQRSDYSIVVLDLNLSDAQGLDVLEYLVKRYPELPKLVLTADTSVSTMQEAYRIGADGFVTKVEKSTVLSDAVYTVLRGQRYVSDLCASLMGWHTVPRTARSLVASSAAGTAVGGDYMLSARQWRVATMAATGMPNKVIADALDIKEGTIKSHLNTVYRVLGVRNRTEMSIRLKEQGIVDPSLPKP